MKIRKLELSRKLQSEETIIFIHSSAAVVPWDEEIRLFVFLKVQPSPEDGQSLLGQLGRGVFLRF